MTFMLLTSQHEETGNLAGEGRAHGGLGLIFLALETSEPLAIIRCPTEGFW